MAGADREVGRAGAPRGHQRDFVVGLEAHQRRRIGADQPSDFLIDGREQLLLRDPARDQHGHAPQRRPLLGHPGRLGARWNPHGVLAIPGLSHVVAAAGHDAPVAHTADLARRALLARAATRKIAVD
jgi:hypothetical protein